MGTDEASLPAGPFAAWLAEIQGAIRGERDAEVACGPCTACCASSQFVHIAPDETDALAHIPKALLFPAPRMPRGHVLLGYDERGRCPMLTDAGCSIYEHRPRTCRTYDCRVFAAAAVTPEDDKPAIARQAGRWVFEHPADADRAAHAAVRAAAEYLRDRADELPAGAAPRTATQRAVAAVEVHDVFLRPAEADADADGRRVEIGRRLAPPTRR